MLPGFGLTGIHSSFLFFFIPPSACLETGDYEMRLHIGLFCGAFLLARTAVIPLIVSWHYMHGYCNLFNTSSAASMMPILALWKFSPPCIHTAKGSRSGASAESSIEEPEVNAPAAIMT